MSEHPGSDGAATHRGEADVVPRLPRGRGLRLSGVQLVRILGLAIVLVVVVMMQRPCAEAVSGFVTGFGDRGSAADVMPRPGALGPVDQGSATGSAGPASPVHYERLRPGMTDAEIKAAIERARATGGGTP
jgi:hypothetical protein